VSWRGKKEKSGRSEQTKLGLSKVNPVVMLSGLSLSDLTAVRDVQMYEEALSKK
jgi:hypothetical protein